MMLFRINKMTLKPQILLLLFTLCAGFNSGYGQILPSAEPTPATQAAPLLPDAWQFMRYGGSMPNLYTGTVNVKIPIYAYKDNDFELPIALSYASNGYRPNEQQGIVGLGWTLSVGGMITREVVGVPDDYSDFSKLENEHRRGYYFYHLLTDNNETVFSRFQEIKNNPGKGRFQSFMFLRGIDGKNLLYETAPDIFSFKFGDHAGKFILGANRKIHVFATNHPSGEYRVEFKYSDDTYPELISIIITTGNGYKYVFGNESTKLHSQIQSGAPYLPDYSASSDYYSLAWPLTEITVPNGREMRFVYSRTHSQSFGPYVAEYDAVKMETGKEKYMCNCQIKRYENSNPPKDIYEARLDTIVIDKTRVIFSYTSKRTQLYQDGDTTIRRNPRQKLERNELGLLSNITIKNGTKTIGVYSANYWYTQTNDDPDNAPNPIPLLRKVRLPDGGIYTMKYYKESLRFPCYGTTGIDYAGYYNGHEDYQLKNRTQTTNMEGALFGMLEKMEYPTGGYTVFEYEPHLYSRVMVRNDEVSAPRLIDTDNQDIQGAGLRIKSITDYMLKPTVFVTSDLINDLQLVGRPNAVSRREYIYQDKGKSSGNCLYYAAALYADRIESRSLQEANKQTAMKDLNVSNSNLSYLVDKTGIEYRTVIEKRNDGSATQYRFSAYDDLPDRMLATDTLYYSKGLVHEGAMFMTAPSLSSQRGKLLEVCDFTGDGSPIRRQTYIYSRNLLAHIPFMKHLFNRYYITHHYVDDYPLVECKTTEYIATDSIDTKQTFTYNERDQLSCTSTYLNDGTEITENTTYLCRFPIKGLVNMVTSQNITNLVTEQESINLKGKNRGVNKIKYDYVKTGQNLIKISGIQTINAIKTPLTVALPAYEKEVTYDLFDKLGNVQQMTDRNGVSTCYVWGYEGQHLVAKVTNAKLSQVGDLLFKHPAFSILSAGLTSQQDLDLRSIPNALVETYDYIPLVGLVKYKDASGIETRYEYYDSGKLKAIKDAEGNPITEYDYSHK